MQVINQPVKYAVEPDGKRYVEVHQPLSHSDKDDPQTMPLALSPALKKFINSSDGDSELIKAALERRSGMPVLVSSGEPVEGQKAAPEVAEQPQSAQVTSLMSGGVSMPQGMKNSTTRVPFFKPELLLTVRVSLVVQTLVSTSCVIFSSLHVRTDCVHVVAELVNFCVQSLNV